MSEKAYYWQDHVPPSEHNGGWAVVMTCHRLLALEGERALSDSGVENVILMREQKISEHGEPPAAFVAAWLRDNGDHHAVQARARTDQDSDASRARSQAYLEATRAVWRRMISTGAKS